MEFGKRNPESSKRIASEIAPIAPHKHLDLLKKIGDPELCEMLANWQNVRAFQENGNATIDDERRIQALFGEINARLKELGRRPLSSVSELP